MTTQVKRPTLAESGTSLGQWISKYARRYALQIGIVGVLLVMWLFLFFKAPRTFQSPDIYKSFAVSIPFFGIMALPITLLIIGKEIDLSFGSIMAISVVAFLAVFNSTGSPLLALIACLGCGFLVGLLNGIIVVKIGLPSLIATIGTSFFWRGAVQVITGARSESLSKVREASPFLHDVLVGRLFGEIPAQMIWMVIIAIIVWVFLNRHRFGAHIYLIGDNDNSARLMGVRTDRVRMLTFAVVGLSSALAGLIASYDISNFFPSLGDGYLLQTLAAVFLGGTPVLGGTGTILGTFVGCFIIGAIEPGIVAVGLTGFWTQLLYGLIIVVSVTMHTVLRQRKGLRTLKKVGRLIWRTGADAP
jgi:simple sugar transport system permease protein